MARSLLSLERALSVLNQCQAYEALYTEDQFIMNGQESLQEGLVGMYVLILQFLSKAATVFSKNTLFKSSKPFGIPTILLPSRRVARMRNPVLIWMRRTARRR